MRILTIILPILISISFLQNWRPTERCEKILDTLTNREIYHQVDTEAKLIGGMGSLYEEIAILKIPKDPDLDQIRLFISFIVEPTGELTGFKTINKIHSAALDNELLQLMQKYKWEPGKCNGKNVPTRITLKVVS